MHADAHARLTGASGIHQPKCNKAHLLEKKRMIATALFVPQQANAGGNEIVAASSCYFGRVPRMDANRRILQVFRFCSPHPRKSRSSQVTNMNWVGHHSPAEYNDLMMS